jgi:hypothetical protein
LYGLHKLTAYTTSPMKISMFKLFFLISIQNRMLPLKTQTHTFGSVVGSPKTQTKTWFPVPYEEFTETCCITRAYAKLLGKLPTTREIPRRGTTHAR